MCFFRQYLFKCHRTSYGSIHFDTLQASSGASLPIQALQAWVFPSFFTALRTVLFTLKPCRLLQEHPFLFKPYRLGFFLPSSPHFVRCYSLWSLAGFFMCIPSYSSPTGLTFSFLFHRTSYGVIHFEAFAGFFRSIPSYTSPTGLGFFFFPCTVLRTVLFTWKPFRLFDTLVVNRKPIRNTFKPKGFECILPRMQCEVFKSKPCKPVGLVCPLPYSRYLSSNWILFSFHTSGTTFNLNSGVICVLRT